MFSRLTYSRTIWLLVTIGLLAALAWQLLPAPQPAPRWLVYKSPAILENRVITVGAGITFTLDTCNNSGHDLNNSGAFIWVREDTEPREIVPLLALTNVLPAGCISRLVTVPMPAGIVPGRWHYEGNICPIIDPSQCSNFYTESFVVEP